MVLFIKFTGGMGVSYQGSVDLSTLPADLLELVEINFSEDNLSRLAAKEEKIFATDSIIYEFKYGDSTKKFDLIESQLSDEKLELVDSLRPYLKILPMENENNTR